MFSARKVAQRVFYGRSFAQVSLLEVIFVSFRQCFLNINRLDINKYSLHLITNSDYSLLGLSGTSKNKMRILQWKFKLHNQRTI
jgi:hypothetical protein